MGPVQGQLFEFANFEKVENHDYLKYFGCPQNTVDNTKNITCARFVSKANLHRPSLCIEFFSIRNCSMPARLWKFNLYIYQLYKDKLEEELMQLSEPEFKDYHFPLRINHTDLNTQSVHQ